MPPLTQIRPFSASPKSHGRSAKLSRLSNHPSTRLPSPLSTRCRASISPNDAIHVAEAAGVLVALLGIGKAAGSATNAIATSLTTTALNTLQKAPGLAFLGQKKWIILVISVGIDAAGMVSFFIPGLGEGEDVVNAPISALLVQALYGSTLLTSVDFLEEALPFTDFIPTATTAWLLEYTPLGNGLREVLKFRSTRVKKKDDGKTEKDGGKDGGKKR